METEENRVKLHLGAAHNTLFLLIIVAGVILSGVLPTTFPVFSEGLTIMGVTLSYAVFALVKYAFCKYFSAEHK